MLRIRLFRAGRKHQPFYKIVVVDKNRAPQGGRFVAELGFLNPKTKEKKLDKELAREWIKKGAKPSDTMHNLLVSEGVLEGKKVDVHKKSKKPVEENKEEVKTEAPAETTKEEPKSEEKTEEVKEESKPEEKKEESKKEEKPKEDKPEEAKSQEEKKEEESEQKETKEEDPKKEEDK